MNGKSRFRMLAGCAKKFGGSTTFGMFDRCPSYAKKKNARSLLIGPPIVAPNWLICDLGRFAPRAVRIGVFEFSDSSRKNSNALPCQSFVPDLVTTLITAPP